MKTQTAQERHQRIIDAIRAEIKILKSDLEADLTRTRGTTNGRLWTLQKMLGTVHCYFSDAGQDMVLDRYVFKGKRDGIFVELGINDGFSGSSCMFFEKYRDWTGIGIDGHSEYVELARKFRSCTIVEAVVADRVFETEFMQVKAGTAMNMMSGIVESLPSMTKNVRGNPEIQSVDRTVTTQTLPDILRANKISKIDYLSMDIEGPEREILAAFPFEEFDITAVSVENHHPDDSIAQIMYANGFVLLDYMGLDEVFVSADVEVGTE